MTGFIHYERKLDGSYIVKVGEHRDPICILRRNKGGGWYFNEPMRSALSRKAGCHNTLADARRIVERFITAATMAAILRGNQRHPRGRTAPATQEQER